MTRTAVNILARVVAVALLAFGFTANAQTLYVSTGAGHQILQIANAGTATPAVSVLCTGSATFAPEDLVVGPDGFVYVANTGANQIWRLNPGSVSACDSNTDPGAELIYSGTNAAEGPTFVSEFTGTAAGSLDLLFNTRNGQGVWKLAGIASLPFGCSKAPSSCTLPAAVQVVQPFSTAGEGTDIDKHGNLLMVDFAGGKLFRDVADPTSFSSPYGPTASAFIGGLGTNSPFGVAVNTCGDILIATGKKVNRYNANTGALLDSLSFTGNNRPKFLEVDAGNHLYLVTASDETGSAAIVWRFDPPATNPLTSCSLNSFTQGFSIDLSSLFKSGTVAGLATGNGLGLGVSASSASSSVQCFPAGVTTTNTYNFGTNAVAFTVDNVVKSFCVQVTAVESKPTDSSNPDVTFSTAPAFSCPAAPTSNTTSFAVPAPTCLHYASDHGHCIQYLEQATDAVTGAILDDATLNQSYCSGYTGAPSAFPLACDFRGLFAFFSLDKFNFPGTAHVSTDNAPNPVTLAYGSNPSNPTDDCQTLYFFPGNGGNGLDPTYTKGTNSKHVVFNSNLSLGPSQIVLGSPTGSCQTVTGCNPQFKFGQNINVTFTFSPPLSPNPGAATERLSIMRVQHTTGGKTVTGEQVVENVVPTNSNYFQNFFNGNSNGQYSYGDDSSAFQPLPKGSTAVYQFTIWGNASPPFSFFLSVQF